MPDRRRTFGRAGALDDAVVDDAVGGEECPGEIDVFGRDPHPPVMLRAESGGDVVEVGHGADVDPGLRHGDHDIGAAKTEIVDQQDALVGIGNAFAHQVFAGDAEMHRAARQLRGNLARREIGDLDIVEPGDGAAIVAGAARFRQRKSGAGEKGLGVFLQAALRGNRENEWRRHDALPLWPLAAGLRPSCVKASIQTENPTAGIGVGAPSWVISPS